MPALGRIRNWIVKYGLAAGLVALAFGYREHRLNTAPEPNWDS